MTPINDLISNETINEFTAFPCRILPIWNEISNDSILMLYLKICPLQTCPRICPRIFAEDDEEDAQRCAIYCVKIFSYIFLIANLISKDDFVTKF